MFLGPPFPQGQATEGPEGRGRGQSQEEKAATRSGGRGGTGETRERQVPARLIGAKVSGPPGPARASHRRAGGKREGEAPRGEGSDKEWRERRDGRGEGGAGSLPHSPRQMGAAHKRGGRGGAPCPAGRLRKCFASSADFSGAETRKWRAHLPIPLAPKDKPSAIMHAIHLALNSTPTRAWTTNHTTRNPIAPDCLKSIWDDPDNH